ncbi:MAG: biopolymer transporter ExbD [Verrucomicrobiales bacterium]|jgi:biopolymer transport protein ExbD|nr:biopolymer transporter ExbD [Verrucomicrobiales bacterium]
MQFYTKRRRMPVINVVSLIDVFCLLLIFYIVTTTFKKAEPAVQIRVPESAAAQAETPAREPVVIYATKAQELYLGEEKIPLARLGEALKARKAQAAAGFSLKADTDVPLGFFVKVMDAAKQAGITDLSMYTEEPQASPAAPAP